jgi:hypothetical protein
LLLPPAGSTRRPAAARGAPVDRDWIGERPSPSEVFSMSATTNATVNATMKAAIPRQRALDPDGKTEDVWALPTDEQFLFALLTDLFDNYYDKLCWGPLLTGAAYELKAPGKPKRIDLSDGFLTVHWGDKGHIHLCIGAISIPADRPNAAEMIAHRRPGRAEFFRTLDRDGYPHTWGLRIFNGKDEPQITVFFPNPYVNDVDEVVTNPDWSRIEVWEQLLPRYTGNAPDGLDRQGRGFGRF